MRLQSSEAALRNLKGIKTFPSSPRLIKDISREGLISFEEAEAYFAKRAQLIDMKNANVVYDERLRPYQNADVHFLKTFNKGKGVFNEQRMGKTPTTLVTMRAKNQNNSLIIVPFSVITHWMQEYERWHGGEIVTPKSHWTQEKRFKFYKNIKNNQSLILNYEKIVKDFEILKTLYFDAIIIDEAHRLRNYKGLEAKGTPPTVEKIIKLRRGIQDAYALTGTLAPNQPHNICGILAFLYPDLFQYYWNVIEYYFENKQETNHMTGHAYPVIGGFKSIQKKEEMIGFLETFSTQRKRKDYMKWIPKVDHEEVYLELDEKEKRIHQELHQYNEYEHIECENHLATMTTLRMLTGCPSRFNLPIRNVKLNWIKQRIGDYPKRRLIIASMFTSILKEYAKALAKHKPELLIGKLSKEKATKIKNKFQQGGIKVLLANIEVIKEGITLSKADELIIVDPSLTYTDNEQLWDRILPTTPEEALKKDTLLITHLIIKETIDVYINYALKNKKRQVDILNDYIKHKKEIIF